MALYADNITAATEFTKNQRIKDKAAEMQEREHELSSSEIQFKQLLIKSKGQKNIQKDLVLEMETGNIKQLEVVKVLGVYISRDELFKEYLVNSNNSMMRFLETRLNMLCLLSRYADLKSRKALAEG